MGKRPWETYVAFIKDPLDCIIVRNFIFLEASSDAIAICHCRSDWLVQVKPCLKNKEAQRDPTQYLTVANCVNVLSDPVLLCQIRISKSQVSL